MNLGRQRQIEYLNKVIKRGRLAHAYLFYGPEGIGKFEVAKMIAKSFYCEEAKKLPSDVCNKCSQCRLIDSTAHPQVVLLSPESTLVSKKDKRKDIPIEDIRELKHRFSFAPQGESWRIAIIDHVDKMSLEAANSFLKLLEEPGRKTLFILVTAFPDLLPPTIVSRTQVIKFYGVRPEIDTKLTEKLRTIVAERNLGQVFKFSEQISYDEKLRRTAARYLLDQVRRKMISAPNLRDAAILKDMLRIFEIMETTNVNPRLALDTLFLKTLSISYDF